MEILQSQEHLASVELCLPKGELLALDMEHKIASTDILHDEVDARLGLEAGMETQQEGMTFLRRGQEDPLFRPRTR